ncbi:MAG: hypothetical protein J7J93_02285, partial [Candidatus Aenigmarchaeota archaeon]|nr:hypothetical protein [Candidatus Aenigmarchaeota archaeon]
MLLESKFFKNTGRFFVLFACFWGFWVTKKVIGEHYINTADYISHIAKEIAIAENIKAGRGIFTFFPQNLGIPFLYMYQPLFHLLVVVVHFLSYQKIPVLLAHNIIAVLCFSLYPLSIYYCLRKFDFPYFLCGLGALFSITPISGWGHTIDAFFRTGIVTRSIAGFLFPFFVGKLYELITKNKRHFFVIILFALLILSHPLYIFFSIYT